MINNRINELVVFLRKNMIRFSFLRVLTFLYILLYVLICIAFYPGFMSYDSLNQFAQIQGLYPLNDWHPPAMTLLWKALMEITGVTGSLLALTVGFFVTSSFLLSIYIHKITGNKKLSIMPFVFLLLPNVLTLMGVLWKDVLIAAFFMLGSVLILLGSSHDKQWKLKTFHYNALLLSGAIFLIIGSTFRHGVWPAFLPILFFGAYKFRTRKITKIALASVYFLLIIMIPPAINRVFSVSNGKASVVVMIDDIINLSTESEVKNSQLSDASKTYLLNVQGQCKIKDVRAYSAFLCDDSHVAFSNTVQSEFGKTQEFWLNTILNDPVEYGIHRGHIFIEFLDPPELLAWQNRTDPNQFGFSTLNSPITTLVDGYVQFFIRNWPSLFKPYLWLITLLVVIFTIVKRRSQLEHSSFMLITIATSLLFLLSFLPAAIVSDYRMTYTPTIATGLIIMVYAVDQHNYKRKSLSVARSSKNKV